MVGFRAAKRYAKGLMQFATEIGKSSEINQEMIDLKNSIQNSRELAQFLSSPVLDSRRKNEIAKELFKNFSPATQNFIKLVIGQRREGLLRQIATQFNALYDYSNNIRTAEVISASELNDELIQEILNKAKAKMGENYSYKIENKVNPDLIGGFILRVGDKQIDSTVRASLNKLKKEFDINDYVAKI
ncbi:MAG: ATP synthase F1 subunit delta [Weeksellaceae bacterium]|jgi:F-type H+-transporting ATPase subunit delta|nr:ATP synthase F1 subunit delta [Weeksellaceae bacterium]MDX9704124.1 ATP synthase F1 subunit delta [Weeksellaceae bacterium]